MEAPLFFSWGLGALTALGCNPSSTPNADPAPRLTSGTKTPEVVAPPKSDAPSSSSGRAARSSDPTPDPITHPCVVLAAQYGSALDKGDTACRADSDCGCYPGGIGRRSGCGGVLNKTSLKALGSIAAEFRRHGCKHTQLCRAWACEPTCRDGQCRK